MAGAEYDVVVVGAGSAGLCCASTLLAEGLNPVLVCETPEVGWAIRPVRIGESSRGFVQHPLYQPGLGGGSWFSAARRLNIPISLHLSPSLHLLNKDSGVTAALRTVPSAAGVTDVFAEFSPMPIDDQRAGIERIMHLLLNMSWDELIAMQATPLAGWLQEQGSDPVLTALMLVLSANLTETTPEVAAKHLSVFGVMTMLRGLMCGESFVTAPKPDPWEGLMIPLGKGLEANGCPVLRGRKAARVIVENGRAVGVALQDGDEIRAKAVALATSTFRVPKLLESTHDEVSAAVDYAAGHLGHDACTYSLLDKPVVPLKNMTMVGDQFGNNLAYLFPMQEIAPDSTEPGKYLLAAQAQFSPADYEAIGGHDGAVKKLLDLQEELYPGFENATIERKEQTHKHHWINPLTHGPKLPQRCEDIPGLYFAGDGSVPFAGFGVEGAGQAGTMRAKLIAADLNA